MATHFQGRFEVEFKYRLTDSAAFVHTLTALSPEVMVADNHEQDCYFDTADGALARAEKSLIIRTMAPSGIRLWIVKGPGPDRCEAVNITDADKAAYGLGAFGPSLNGKEGFLLRAEALHSGHGEQIVITPPKPQQALFLLKDARCARKGQRGTAGHRLSVAACCVRQSTPARGASGSFAAGCG